MQEKTSGRRNLMIAFQLRQQLHPILLKLRACVNRTTFTRARAKKTLTTCSVCDLYEVQWSCQIMSNTIAKRSLPVSLARAFEQVAVLHATCNFCDSARRACNSHTVAESALVAASASFAISRTLSDKVLQFLGADDVSYGSTQSQMKVHSIHRCRVSLCPRFRPQ